MKLITWNTARRKQTVKVQVAYLQSRSPDVVALQEVTKNTSDHLAVLLLLASTLSRVFAF
jgi:exonuclease III